MDKLAENKAQLRAWLLSLLSKLELAEEVEGELKESGHTTTLIVTMK